MQLGQLHKIESQVIELGYQIIAISADRPEKLQESVQKHELNYTVLSDSKAISPQAFGIAFILDDKTLERYKQFNIDIEDASGQTHHILPAPSAFVVGTDGTIKFSYTNPNHRVRIDPDVLLAAAKAALKKDK